jgi:ParB family chromosome partitioning protein
LPKEKKMRHESHFVEEITATRSDAIGRMMDLERVTPNPHQPRKHFGDLSEMVASVKEKGILEPILVRYDEEIDQYMIIAGERRYQAAKLAGLSKVPCIEVDVDNRGMLEISLVENLQRKDLTPFEEAAALKRLSEHFRYTHEEIARKLGKSRTVVTEALSLAKLPDEIIERCRHADINSKSMLLQIVRQDSTEAMHRLIDKIAGDGITREEARKFNREAGAKPRAKNYTFRYRPEDKSFQVSLTFRKAEVERDELIQALQQLLKNLEQDERETPAAANPEADPVDEHPGIGPTRPNNGQRQPTAQA